MFRTGVGEAARRGLGLEVEQGVHVGGGQRLAAPRVELRRPAGDAGAGVPQGGQVVGEEAAADDQDTFVAQRARLRPMSISRAGSRVGRDIWSTGMSAPGYISTSGT